MKDCNTCRYCYNEGGEYTYYVCELFGDDAGDFEKGEGCCLHHTEVKKAIRLLECVSSWEYRSFPNAPTDYEKKMLAKAIAEYNAYMKHLEQKYGVTDDEI